MLVPEIALTPQLVGRFRSRFQTTGGAGSPFCIRASPMESATMPGGPSSAAKSASSSAPARPFSRPSRELGIVVVDEEHEGSYKQGEGFRYHGRDLALLRGQMAGAMVLLGSATPALTTFHRAETGKTGYLSAGRAGRLPRRCRRST